MEHELRAITTNLKTMELSESTVGNHPRATFSYYFGLFLTSLPFLFQLLKYPANSMHSALSRMKVIKRMSSKTRLARKIIMQIIDNFVQENP